MVQWLVSSTSNLKVGGSSLVAAVVFPWTRNFMVYKSVPATIMLGVTVQWTSISSGGGGGVAIFLVASRCRNQS